MKSMITRVRILDISIAANVLLVVTVALLLLGRSQEHGQGDQQSILSLSSRNVNPGLFSNRDELELMSNAFPEGWPRVVDVHRGNNIVAFRIQENSDAPDVSEIHVFPPGHDFVWMFRRTSSGWSVRIGTENTHPDPANTDVVEDSNADGIPG